jgi:FKBP-type peptidyl-prolyl cis-trans isomerase
MKKFSKIKFILKYLIPVTILIIGFIFYMDFISLSNEVTSDLNQEQIDELLDENQDNQSEVNVERNEEVQIEDLIVGEGVEAKDGDKITVNYVGTLTDGTKFDNSYDRNKPFVFTLGNGEVIQGWDEGILGMKIGGKRKLTIPPSLGYGESGSGDVIPPNSTLIFEVELISIND